MDKLAFFEKLLYEAEGDDPPEPSAEAPEMSEDNMDGPPDMGGADSDPPEMGDDFSDGFDDGFGDDNQDGENPEENLELDEKISAIMNMNLYQRYLSLLSKIDGQITMIKENNDVLFTISPKSIELITSLQKLDENIRLYIKHTFINENYSKNLLFFNKCLNLLKLLNDVFDENIKQGMKDM